ncbi:MAG: OpgC domain-containing protein [Salinisphaera sp.]|uniref:OpgC domain-containing protein n=1 Tax=Salinisphaera sp. TaxID=1914330 RepID=UPI003C7C8452
MRGRDDRVDSIRGVMLAIMLIDHIGGAFKTLTWEPLGFVSAAEGFVFLSGYMFAVVYAKDHRSNHQLLSLSVKRAVFIYRYHISCLAIILVMAWAVPTLGYYWRTMLHPIPSDPLYYGIFSMLLIEAPKYFDILPMYFCFVLVTPLIIWALRKGLILGVAGLSIGVWLLGFYIDPVEALSALLGPLFRTMVFNLFSWQLLWTLGLLTGFYREQIRLFATRLRPLMLIALIGFGFLLFLSRHHWIGLAIDPALVVRTELGWLRVANFIAIALVFAWIISRVPIDMKLPWFCYIGRKSIQVFSFHILVVYLSVAIGWHILALGGEPLFALYTLGCLASLTVPAFLSYRLSARRKAVRRPKAHTSSASNPRPLTDDSSASES